MIAEPFHPQDVSLGDPFVDSDSPASDSSSISQSYSVSLSSSTTNDSNSDAIEHSESDSDYEFPNIDEPFVSEDFDLLSYEQICEGEDLYQSSSITVTKALGILFSWFCSSPGISKNAFSRLLYLMKNFLLPEQNCLPSSYEKALEKIKQFLVPIQKYHCCVNDCILFRNCKDGKFEDMECCPKCMEPRFQSHSKIPRKVFKYVPLGPRLKRMFSYEKTAKDLQIHMTADTSSSIVSDIHESNFWKEQYSTTGPFQGDPRGISLSFETDGMNPFSKEKVVYSMWPIIVTILNLPRILRNLPGSMLLMGIIPGRAEPKNLDPYLCLLVDEIETLNGLSFYDAYRREHFSLKVDIMLHVLDYPGQNKVFHCQGN